MNKPPLPPARARRPVAILVADPMSPYGRPPAPKRKGPGFLNISVRNQVIWGVVISIAIIVLAAYIRSRQ